MSVLRLRNQLPLSAQGSRLLLQTIAASSQPTRGGSAPAVPPAGASSPKPSFTAPSFTEPSSPKPWDYLDKAHARRLQAMRDNAAAAIEAVRREAERLNAAWRALPEEEKQRRRRPRLVSDAQFDADREADAQGITTSDYLKGI